MVCTQIELSINCFLSSIVNNVISNLYLLLFPDCISYKTKFVSLSFFQIVSLARQMLFFLFLLLGSVASQTEDSCDGNFLLQYNIFKVIIIIITIMIITITTTIIILILINIILSSPLRFSRSKECLRNPHICHFSTLHISHW